MTIGIEACGIRRERAIAGLWIGLGRGSFRLRLILDGVRAAAALGRGDPPHRAGLEMLHAPVVTLTSARPLDLARDGEAERVSPPVTLLVQESALGVMSLEPVRPPDPPIPGPHQL